MHGVGRAQPWDEQRARAGTGGVQCDRGPWPEAVAAHAGGDICPEGTAASLPGRIPLPLPRLPPGGILASFRRRVKWGLRRQAPASAYGPATRLVIRSSVGGGRGRGGGGGGTRARGAGRCRLLLNAGERSG